MNCLIRAAALILCLVGVSPQALALNTDREQPISIEADWAEADDARRITVYKGKVVMVQGSIRITGDVVTMYYDINRSMTKLVATGRPARFRQKSEDGEQLQRANASRLEYLVNTDTMVLIGGAQLSQGSNKVSADRIVYDTKKSRLKAEAKPSSGKSQKGAKKGKGRVRIVIEPKSKQ